MANDSGEPQTTIGQRLERAIHSSPYSKRGFAKAMEGKDVIGAQYRTLVNYLNDRTGPSVEYLRMAAGLLGVRETWLAFGEGPMTDAEAEVGAVAEAATHPGRGAVDVIVGRDLLGEVLEGLNLSERPSVLPHWVPSLREVEVRTRSGGLADAARRAVGYREEDLPPVDLVSALRAPLDAFGLDPEHLQSPGDYIASMVPVLLSLAEERNRQRWVESTEPHDQEDDDA